METLICHRERDQITRKAVKTADYRKEKNDYNNACKSQESFTVAQMKERLRANSQKVSGTKAELIRRIADWCVIHLFVFRVFLCFAFKQLLCSVFVCVLCLHSILYGCMPRCTSCGTARLRVIYANNKAYGHSGNGRFFCPGFDYVFKTL